jgi:hypothetical protein
VINAPKLLADLTRLLKQLEADLLSRIEEVTELKASLQAEWQAARDADRTAETFETWVDQIITQAGVHWLLSCVFLRFIEDNKLVDRPWLGGTPESGNLALARDRHEAYFRANPLHSDREYLLASFREAGALPGLHTFFDEVHNPVFRLGISGDAAMVVRQFWQQVDPNTGALAHDFTDPTWNTRFLGDLYQDLSEATRKRYALLQTPEFVEEFILDRTLTPAIREFGYREASLIDPTCGSGHFLLGGFRRLVDEWQQAEPSRNRRDVAQKALDAIAGVDLNPFAVAISRFRLLVAALLASDVHKMSGAPDFRIQVAIGDSLLHGKRFGMTVTDGMFEGVEHYARTGLAHAYASEDLTDVQRILGRQYHAVVGNPPYIVVKDAALNAAYRLRYVSCHKKYSLGCPFTERFFELGLTGRVGQAAGYVGLITANSFMKAEFGKKLIEEYLPRVDLTHVVDTRRASIPGHDTPTVILLGRNRIPVGSTVRTVMGIKGESSTPTDPAQGLVWRAIVNQIDKVGSESPFISVTDTARATFAHHPWSIGGGGAADLKDLIESDKPPLKSAIQVIGVFGMTNADEAMLSTRSAFLRRGVEDGAIRPLAKGDAVRDWVVGSEDEVFFPYRDGQLISIATLPGAFKWFWPVRTVLGNRATFGKKTYFAEGRPWWEWHQVALDRLNPPLTIACAFVATHNHFALDRGVKVFKQTALVIKLLGDSDENAHLGLLGLLNSSVACFWLKQVCFPRGGITGELWAERLNYNATKVEEFPLVARQPIDIARKLNNIALQLISHSPAAAVSSTTYTRNTLDAARCESVLLRRQMIAAQEELDWRVYRLYGLLSADTDPTAYEHHAPPIIALGERAFEIVLARRLASGIETSTWFERHGSAPITDIPSHWPELYKQVVQRRIDLIESDRNIGLVERPEYKRRWSSPKWEDLEKSALRDWLLARLESRALWVANIDQPPQLNTASRLADTVQRDAEFMQIAALFAGHADFEVAHLVASLVSEESVPFLPALRYSDTGLRKRAQWEDTWALQRREDKGESVGNIPVPPKYKKEDFLKVEFWDLRGGLDVPKERWVSYPGCERGADTSLPIAWAGWDHLQQATALAAYYLEMKESEGWEAARLQPLLAGLLELVPWLEQWHNEIDPVYGERMGAYYKGFVSEEARMHGFTLDELRSWKPAATPTRRGRRQAE